MSLLDAFKGAFGQLSATAAPGLISEVLAKTGFGDLQTVVAQLEESGLGSEAQPWLGNGSNLPVSPDQLRSALGDERVRRSHNTWGFRSTVLNLVAEHLPAAVNPASPDGTVPAT